MLIELIDGPARGTRSDVPDREDGGAVGAHLHLEWDDEAGMIVASNLYRLAWVQRGVAAGYSHVQRFPVVESLPGVH